jgi:hypothetical protein
MASARGDRKRLAVQMNKIDGMGNSRIIETALADPYNSQKKSRKV